MKGGDKSQPGTGHEAANTAAMVASVHTGCLAQQPHRQKQHTAGTEHRTAPSVATAGRHTTRTSSNHRHESKQHSDQYSMSSSTAHGVRQASALNPGAAAIMLHTAKAGSSVHASLPWLVSSLQ